MYDIQDIVADTTIAGYLQGEACYLYASVTRPATGKILGKLHGKEGMDPVVLDGVAVLWSM